MTEGGNIKEEKSKTQKIIKASCIFFPTFKCRSSAEDNKRKGVEETKSF